MNKKLFSFLALVGLLSACGSNSQDTFPPRDTDTTTQESSFSATLYGTVKSGIAYCTANSSQTMDFYYPEADSVSSDAPTPVVVYVHGGGWTTGDNKSLSIYREVLVSKGIAVAALNYSLAPASVFPAAIQDLKCAVRSLRAHAQEYNIDPDKIGGYGGSAGGHLVSLLGVSADQDQWDVGEYLTYSSALSAVVDLYGPEDLTVEFPGNSTQSLKNVFGDTSYSQAADQSPVTYVDSKDPPFLIMHGVDDTLVPIAQGEEFYQDLQDAGVDVTFIPVKGAGHTFAPTVKGVSPDPSMQEIADIMSDWLVDQLK